MIKQIFISIFLISISSFAKEHSSGVSFVAFGDSGYHYDYIKQSTLDHPETPETFLKHELESWLEKYLPENEFKAPPMYTLPNGIHAVEKSGAVPVAKAMTSFCKTNDCQFGVMLGDNIYSKGATGTDDEARFKKIFKEPYENLVMSRPGFKLYAALGNHDWKTSRIGRDRQIEYGKRAETAFTMESPGYYKFLKGNVEFFVIDTNLLLAGTVVMEKEINPDGSEKESGQVDLPEPWELPNQEDRKQLKWLENSLKISKAKWKVVYGHHTLWSAGGGKFEEARALRKLITPLICRYADVYISGHEHELEVNLDSCQNEIGTSKHPLPLVVSGAGAWQRPVHHPFQTFQEIKYSQFKALWSKGMTWGFAHFEFLKDKMILKMITTADDGSGIPILNKKLIFKNRSRFINQIKM